MLVIDAGKPRNAASHAMHGFLSLDGLDPAELRRMAHGQLDAYPNVTLAAGAAKKVAAARGGFQVTTLRRESVAARKLLLAIGITDDLPQIEGFTDYYGRSVFHCPYCDGWEFREQPVAVHGTGPGGLRMALLLLGWCRDVVFCTHGLGDFSAEDRALLVKRGVRLDEQPIVRFEGKGGQLERIVYRDGTSLHRCAVFFHGPTRLDSVVPQELGCAMTDAGRIEVDEGGRTSVPGVYAAGDAARRRGQHPASQVIFAAGSGALAAISLQQDLMQEDVGLTPSLPAAPELFGSAP